MTKTTKKRNPDCCSGKNGKKARPLSSSIWILRMRSSDRVNRDICFFFFFSFFVSPLSPLYSRWNIKEQIVSSSLSRIRYFDAFILIPNLIFLLFLIIKWSRTRTKLNPGKPLLFTVCCLICTVSLVNISRCIYAMIFADQRSTVKTIILKVKEKRERE